MASRYAILVAVLLGFATYASAQTAPKVLGEVFSNTNCGNCKTPDEQFGSFIANNPQYGVVRISYHNEVTNQFDTLYLASQPYSGYRSKTFYNVVSDPWGVMNGQVLQANESAWELWAKGHPITAPNVAVTATNNGDGTYNIHVVNKATPGKAVRLYVALTESHIVMANTLAYGNPTSGYWDDIFRQMLPERQGTDAFTPTGNDAYDFGFTPPTPDSLDQTGHTWNPKNMKAIAWIQDDQGTTKNVEALGVFNFGGSGVSDGPAVSVASLRVIGDPSHSDLRVTLPSASHTLIAISDLLGRSVGALFDGTLPQGETTVQLSSAKLPAGCYVVRMSVDGQPDAVTKLIVQ